MTVMLLNQDRGELYMECDGGEVAVVDHDGLIPMLNMLLCAIKNIPDNDRREEASRLATKVTRAWLP